MAETQVKGWIVRGNPKNKKVVSYVKIPSRILDRATDVQVEGKTANLFATEFEAQLIMDFYTDAGMGEFTVESYPQIDIV